MTTNVPDFRITGPLLDQSPACAPILRALPDWFGVEQSTQNYIMEIDRLETFLAFDQTGRTLGFLSLKTHTPYAAEIYVMGVLPEAHGGGIGRALVEASIAHLRTQGIEYLQVKTLGPSHPDSGYVATRAFYLALGFRPLEEFKQIWDEYNPCLILVQRL
ncbi:MAG TPA: GNAT family N-acetyltransferase [Anaerolineaceae bacterium]|nr:GNAT family N-acetyltransferase [Anaerolineaceae bacterium]